MSITTFRKYISRLSLIVLLMGSVKNTVAQELVFKNISNELNLPAHECYNVVQDGKGYIWLSTENGLCRYNGSTIKIFNKNSKLQDNAVYFLESSKTGVKAITSENRIFNSNDTLFTETSYSKSYSKITNQLSLVTYFSSVKDGFDIINTYDQTYKANLKTSEITAIKYSEVFDVPTVTIVYERGKSYIARQLRPETMRLREKPETFINLNILSGNQKKTINIPYGNNTDIDRRIKLCEINGVVFVAIHNKIIRILPSLEYSVFSYPSQILSVYTDNDKGLWIGLFQKGLVYHANSDLRKQITALSGYSVTGILLDREGSVWCTTLEKGVFYCGNPNAISYGNIPQLKKIATVLKTAGNNVFTSTGYDNFFMLRNGNVIKKDMDMLYGSDYTDILFHENRWYLGGKGGAKIYNSDFKNGKSITTDGVFNNQYKYDSFGSRVFSMNLAYIYEIKDKEAIVKQNVKKIRAKCMLFYDENTIYLGSGKGLFRYDIKENLFENVKNINTPVSDLLKTKDGRLWIATKGNGILVMDKNRTINRVPFPPNSVDVFLDLEEDQNQTVWAATSNGLFAVKKQNGKTTIKSYKTANGLISNDINQLAISRNTLYVSTVDGLCSVDIEKGLDNVAAPLGYLNAVKVNDKIIDKNREMSFPYDENSVQFTFDVLTFRRDGGNLIYYKLAPDKNWKTSKTNELNFDNLSPNDYTLTVFTLNNDGKKSESPMAFKFTIQKPFWQEIWFIIFIIVAFGTLLFVSVRSIIRKIRFRESEKTRINNLISESQLSALQAQMNPHFIFNAISSIQNFVLKNDANAAFEYLAKFGKLIRMVLNNSRASTLYLYEEIETLQTYVELEQMRFKNGFEFCINVDETIDAYSVQLPAMLIQPYIENAIWHGLMNIDKNKKGVLSLQISRYNTMLKIIVEDNGIGRKHSENYKKETIHLPVGMKLTEQRLETLHKLNEYEGLQLTITDLYDADGNAAGTNVTIILPIT